MDKLTLRSSVIKEHCNGTKGFHTCSASGIRVEREVRGEGFLEEVLAEMSAVT